MWRMCTHCPLKTHCPRHNGDWNKILYKLHFDVILVINDWGVELPLDEFHSTLLTICQHWLRCLVAPSHYLSQCWPRSISPHGITRPQWLNRGPAITNNCDYQQPTWRTPIPARKYIRCSRKYWAYAPDFGICVRQVSIFAFTEYCHLIHISRLLQLYGGEGNGRLVVIYNR